jgi:outer membrane protein assembly factor BamB
VLSDVSRRKILLSGGSVAVGAIAAACGSARATGAARPRPKAGTLLWRTSVPSSDLTMAAAAGTLCMAAGPGFRGLSAGNGKESWSLSGYQGDPLGTVLAVSDEAFIVTGTSAAVALDPLTGRQKWRFSLPTITGLLSVSHFATDSTTVYATGVSRSSGSPQIYIFAIDAVTGDRKWATYFPLTAEISWLSAGDGVVCALSGVDSATMIALDARTGARMWTAPGPAVPDEGTIAGGVISGLSASTAGASGVVAIDVLTGSTLWTTNVGGTMEWTASDGGIVYVPTFNGPEQIGVPGELVALDAHSGKRLWARHFAEGAPLNLQPAGAVVYTGFNSNVMHALDSRTGDTLWTYTMPLTGKDQLSDIVLTPGRVCLASLNGAIFALEA